MRATHCAVSERPTTTDEHDRFTLSHTTVGGQANDSSLEQDQEDSDSNVWVRAVLHESIGNVLDLGIARLNVERREVSYRGRKARFTPLDFAMLLVLTRHRNSMISYARIYRRLWGPISKVSVPRLRVRACRVRHKLEALRLEGIRIVNRVGLGYVLEVDSRLQSIIVPMNAKTGNGAPAILNGTSGRVASGNVYQRSATAAE